MKTYAIVKNNRGFWLMEKDDFRYNDPRYGYRHFANVKKIGKYVTVAGHNYKGRFVQTTKNPFFVFFDGSAIKA